MKSVRLSGFQIKLLGMVFMLFDHCYIFFGDSLHFPTWLSWLTHFVAPLFLYILTEGFFHTSSRVQYAIRLLIGMMVMTVINICHNLILGNYLTSDHKLSLAGLFQGYNIFQTFLFFFLLYMLLESYIEKSDKLFLKFLGILVLSCCILLSDQGIYLLPLGIAFFCFKARKRWSALAIGVFSLILLAKSLIAFLNLEQGTIDLLQYLTSDNHFTIIFSGLIIAIYNGERGGNGAAWQKYLFYIFYPLHLIIIYCIQYYLL